MSFVSTIFSDNVGFTYLFQNPMFHSRMKHIEVDFHFVRNQVHAYQVHVQHLNFADQVTNIVTKPLSSSLFTNYFRKLSMLAPLST